MPDDGRAAVDAAGVGALDAALGRAQRLRPAVAVVDLGKIRSALAGIAFDHRHLVRLHLADLLVVVLVLAQQLLDHFLCKRSGNFWNFTGSMEH